MGPVGYQHRAGELECLFFISNLTGLESSNRLRKTSLGASAKMLPQKSKKTVDLPGT